MRSFSVGRGALPTDQACSVDGGVRDDDNACEYPLQLARQALGIQHRRDVVLEKALAVAALAGAAPQPVLERRQRADAAARGDEDAPGRGQQVRDHQTAVARDQQAAADHEQHEREVQREDEVREQRIDQGNGQFLRTSAWSFASVAACAGSAARFFISCGSASSSYSSTPSLPSFHSM
jgi:hypothetical protein